MKISSVWISWNTTEHINDVMLKTFLSCAKSLHRYFRIKHQTILTSHLILFTHLSGLRHDLTSVCPTFINIRPSFAIIRYPPQSAQHRKPIYFWCQAREGSKYNYERLRYYKLQYWIQSLGKYLRRSVCSART